MQCDSQDDAVIAGWQLLGSVAGCADEAGQAATMAIYVSEDSSRTDCCSYPSMYLEHTSRLGGRWCTMTSAVSKQ